MQTLADFKKALAMDGAIIRHTLREYFKDGEWVTQPINPALAIPRRVAKLQTNAVAFDTENKSGKSWLYFEKASFWKFDGNTATYENDGLRLTYEINY